MLRFFTYGFRGCVRGCKEKMNAFFKNRTIAIKAHSFFSYDRFNAPKCFTFLIFKINFQIRNLRPEATFFVPAETGKKTSKKLDHFRLVLIFSVDLYKFSDIIVFV